MGASPGSFFTCAGFAVKSPLVLVLVKVRSLKISFGTTAAVVTKLSSRFVAAVIEGVGR